MLNTETRKSKQSASGGKKKLFLLSLFCLSLSYIALYCNDLVIPENPPPPSGYNYKAISLYTGNGGSLWYVSNVEYGGIFVGSSVQGMCSLSDGLNTLCLLANGYEILKSTNFGANWFHSGAEYQRVFRDITSMGDGNGFIIANYGIKMTTDTGSHWLSVSIPSYADPLWAIDFGNEGMAGIIIPENPGDTTLITIDGGLSWTAGPPITPDYYINDIKFAQHFPNYRALVCGHSGKIFETTDYGGSWTEITSPTNQNLTSIAFNGDGAIIVGDGGVILRSIDIGQPFTLVTSGVTNNLKKVYIGGSNYWAVGDNVILRSSDQGSTWTTMRNVSDEYYKDLIFIKDEGIVVGSRRISN